MNFYKRSENEFIIFRNLPLRWNQAVKDATNVKAICVWRIIPKYMFKIKTCNNTNSVNDN